MPFVASLVMFFLSIPGFLDCVYNEIFIVSTKIISNPVLKFISEKKLWSLKLGLILNSFPLSDLDETCYIDSFRDGICAVCIFFFSEFPSPPHFLFPKSIRSDLNNFEPRILNPVLIKTFSNNGRIDHLWVINPLKSQ